MIRKTTINKAISAALFAALAPLVAALLAGRHPTAPELYVAAGMGLAALLTTYRVPYFRATVADEESARHRG